MGGMTRVCKMFFKDVPDEALEGVLGGFSKVLLRVFSVVPSTVDNLVGNVHYNVFSLRLSLVV